MKTSTIIALAALAGVALYLISRRRPVAPTYSNGLYQQPGAIQSSTGGAWTGVTAAPARSSEGKQIIGTAVPRTTTTATRTATSGGGEATEPADVPPWMIH